ncbi:MAG: shikimate kinase [Cellulomonadaceae bacterium]
MPEPTTGAQHPRVVLIGPPGSGKSTTARALGALTGWDVRDTDDDVVVVAGKPITEIFVDDGEPHFRELEREAVTTALATHTGILALGGGAVLDALTQSALDAYVTAGGVVVFLDVTLQYAAPRVGFNRSRPLLLGNPRAQWQQMMNARRAVYEAISTHQLLTDAKRPADVAAEIHAIFPEPPSGSTA